MCFKNNTPLFFLLELIYKDQNYILCIYNITIFFYFFFTIWLQFKRNSINYSKANQKYDANQNFPNTWTEI